MMNINWNKFASRVTGRRARLPDRDIAEFMFIDVMPVYTQERPLLAQDLYGRYLGDQMYEACQGWHEENIVKSTRLRVEVIDQSSFRRMVDALKCEYLIDGRWLSFEDLMK